MTESATAAPQQIVDLVERFEAHRDSYQSPSYNETQLRREFVDPFFKALGWDIDNEQGYAEAYKDVVHEDAVKIGGTTKAPDYSFRVGGQRKFFVETKKPSVNIAQDVSPAFQLRRYAWTAKLPLSILTDFEEFAVYDCLVHRPNKYDKASKGRTLYIRYTEYVDRWDEIASIFSREAILKGSFDKYAQAHRKKRGTAEVDDEFLKEIENWRNLLARNLALRNPNLSQRELNFAVQRTIDRIIFLRICEDRGVEREAQLQVLLNGSKVYSRLCELFEQADDRYNSGLFHFHKEKGRIEEPDTFTLSLKIDDKPLKEIIGHLYYPDSPYEFSVFPADILGQVYEQFLGKVIRLTKGHQAKIEEKPEVKKAGGVYYTPTYIVDYIVEQTVGKMLEGKSPQQVGGLTKTWKPSRGKLPLTVLDPACGSGSFLIGAYQKLLDWHRDWYVEDGPARHKDRIYPSAGGDWRLTTVERKRILLSHIYGVDIDPQAVEVTKLSLLLKVLEGENRESLQRQLTIFKERALPDLSSNIKCGNSLIGPDFYDGKQNGLFDDEDHIRVNAFDWDAEFSQIMQRGGFDAVIGNPPYVRMEMFKEIKQYLRQHYDSHAERTDLYAYFIEKEHQLLRRNGRFGMIVSNKFVRANYGEPLRRTLESVAAVERIVDLAGLPVFRGATVRTIVLITSRSIGNGRRWVTYSPPPTVDDLHRVSAGECGLVDVCEPIAYKIRVGELNAAGWRLIRPDHAALIDRLHQNGTPLHGYINGRALFGLKTGYNEAFIIDADRQRDILRIERHSAGRIKPILFGRDIRRYRIVDSGRRVIYCHPEVDIADYPAIGEYLAPHRRALLRRAGQQEWFELQQPAVALIPYLGKPKIVYPIIANECRFTLDADGFFVNDKSFVLPSDDVALVALLNSKASNFYFSLTCAALEGPGDRYLEFRAQYVDSFPVARRMSAKPVHDSLSKLGSRMLDLNAGLAEAKTDHQKTALQRQIQTTDNQIDQLVYELYGLTDEEIRIVEEATAQ